MVRGVWRLVRCVVLDAPPRGCCQKRRAQLGVGDSAAGRARWARRWALRWALRARQWARRRVWSRLIRLPGRRRGNGSWVAHLLDAVDVSRTHEAADACKHSIRCK